MTDIVPGALTGPAGATIAAANVTVARERYYHVTVPSDGELWSTTPCPSASGCDIPDALIPKIDQFYNQTRNAFPFTVGTNQNQTFWLDVFVPLGQAPGAYTGTLTVNTSDGDTPVNVALSVNGLELPSTSTLREPFKPIRTNTARRTTTARGSREADGRSTRSTPKLRLTTG